MIVFVRIWRNWAGRLLGVTTGCRTRWGRGRDHPWASMQGAVIPAPPHPPLPTKDLESGIPSQN